MKIKKQIKKFKKLESRLTALLPETSTTTLFESTNNGELQYATLLAKREKKLTRILNYARSH